MSADKRKKIIVVFGSLAVVLGAAIFVVSPKFKPEDAIGAIGAVQKHRAPQIAQKDVILGDEQAKQQQQLLYGDFLADAAALQSISANMSTGTRAEVRSNLAARGAAVDARYIGAAREQVKGMKAYMAKDSLEMKKLEALDSDLAAAASRARSREDVAALNVRMESEVASVDSALRARDLKSVEADVAGLSARIANRDNADGIRSTMAAAAATLDARNNAAAIRAREEYLSAMAKQSAVLRSAEEALSTGARSESQVRESLGVASHDLAQRALDNMRSNFESQSAAAESLGRMANSMTRAASTADLGLRGDVNSFAERMQVRSTEAASHFNYGMHAQLVGMSAYLASAKQYDARTASAADFSAYLGSLSKAAENRSALYASVLGNEDFATQSLSLHKAFDQLGSTNLKGVSQLGSTNLKGVSQLESTKK